MGVELFGWVANSMYFGGGFCKDHRLTIGVYALASILYVVLYCATGLYIAALSIGIIGLRGFLSLFLNEQQNKISVVTLTVIVSFLICLNIEHVYDALILLAGIAVGISHYCRNNPTGFRILTCLSQVMWIIHSLHFGVYSMLFTSALMILSNSYALIQYDGFLQKGGAFMARYAYGPIMSSLRISLVKLP